ncbi:peptidoglycan-associated lipoprotein Pal [Parasutterella secunda]|jgi:peptidoglycan-associated lipoprotein|uniref:peptidoglycan-associated lipoprotein Pal n=1 Tax=Parasutterella secunda TaxID=626947 RepID=UPI00033E5439|nr:peptidoglycan-associated lipoprotein Pal [Parasutterella secunda]CDE76682.1 ompA domain-containing protein [Sutterella sp. CAG:521]HIR20943.1 peptidoglycan-associated lipoprotein Pal [Candidatus Aphodousia faecalis]HJI93652.1 peptidoglycan-associated lipoprotein Pal [Sutterellaceae bacterium]MCL1595912.1 peptidoglycan-associated lipoprotein Pal [Parasutterella secunda]MCR8920566.1 peptidoglycan-associated lipoprotein Pal [Parasutterella secunda]
MQLKSKILLVSLGLAGALLTGCSSVDLNPNGPDAQYAGDPFSNPNSPLSQQSIYFAFDSYTVPAESQAMIEAHAQYLATHPSATVVLEGNTDERGGREYNLALGQKRSDSVENRLQLLGVPSDRMESVSFGKERPRAMGHDEESYQQNRRVDIIYRTK